MAKLLAPYNNAMRLGQGFNSFTQQICIDDAVIVSESQKENVVNNAGMTMRMIKENGIFGSKFVQNMEKKVLPKLGLQEQEERLNERRKSQKPADGDKVIEDKDIKEKVKAGTGDALSLKEMDGQLSSAHRKIDDTIAKNTQGLRRNKDKEELSWSAEQAIGPSQSVTYTSKFINKISDITDDMGISGSLAIKYNAIGGSGSGAFFDAEKFYDSDLKYYISVKVVNQSINIKDAMMFNPLRSCMRQPERFKKIFGDSFISGFQEGGEFNALILLNVHNKKKKRDIEAEAKIALTAGPVEISAQGNLKLAEENINNNTEMSIYVRWCGGGNIKPYDEDWTLGSILQAASRFPALVGIFPQRTYAILTKYETLRSYLSLKPKALTPLQYEVAQLYTRQLLDAYMEYKSLSKRILTDITDIQAEIKVFKAKDSGSQSEIPLSLLKAHLKPFVGSINGLNSARREVQKQLNLITGELDKLTNKPELALDENRPEQFVSPSIFSYLMPLMEMNDKRKRTTNSPLELAKLNKKIDEQKIETDVVQEVDEDAPPLFGSFISRSRLSEEEETFLGELEWNTYGIGNDYRVCCPVGNSEKGSFFCTLEIAQNDAIVTDFIAIKDTISGDISSLAIAFSNGLVCTLGKSVTQSELDSSPYRITDLDPKKENVTSLAILYGDEKVSGIKISLSNQKKMELCSEIEGDEKPKQEVFTTPSNFKHISGFWGRADENGIHRLGVIWGKGISHTADGTGVVQSGEIPCFHSAVAFNRNTGERDIRYFSSSDVLPGAPGHVIHSTNFMRPITQDRANKIQMGSEISDITSEGFKIKANPSIGQDEMLCSWMVLPEAKDYNGQSGLEDMNGSLNSAGSKLLKKITLEGFKESIKEENIKVHCWFTIMDTEKSEGSATFHIKASATQISRDSFVAAIETETGITADRIQIGWVAYAIPETKDSTTFTGKDCTLTQFPKDSASTETKIEPFLQRTPNHSFVALNEILADMSQGAIGLTVNIQEMSKEKVLINAGSLVETQKEAIKKLGFVFLLSV